MKNFLFALILSISTISVYAQCPGIYEDCNTPPIYNSIDSLDGFTSCLPVFSGVGLGSLCSGIGSIDNPIYFSFIAESTGVQVSIDVSNCSEVTTGGTSFSGMQAIIIDPCDPNTCYNILEPNCEIDNFSIQAENLIIGNQYQLVLDGCAGSVCDFTLNAEVIQEVVCVSTTSLTVFRPEFPNEEVTGPYCSGETVNFCYSVDFISSSVGDPNGNNCQWIQGIVPVVGCGWDLGVTSLDNQGPGGSIWLGDNEVDYNVVNPTMNTMTGCCGQLELEYEQGGSLNPGDLLPQGYWFTSSGATGCANDGDPDTMWGLPSACGSTTTVDFCFDLTVKELTVEDCDEMCVSDLKVQIFVFGDGETGCWTDASCAGDVPINLSGVATCDAMLCDNQNNDCPGIVESCDLAVLYNPIDSLDGFASCQNLGNGTVLGILCESFVIDNPAYFSFIASSTSVIFNIDVANCSMATGLQATVIDPCDATICYSEIGAMCQVEDFSFTAINLVPGQEYQLLIDGCGGDVCDFTIHVVNQMTEVDLDGDGWDAVNDCDDNNPVVNPGAQEICDGIDNNCDGNVDEGLGQMYFLDSDGDGFGDPNNFIEDCVGAPIGYSLNNTDCDDTDPAINGDAVEIPDNGIDENCDGIDSINEDCLGIVEDCNLATLYNPIDLLDGFASCLNEYDGVPSEALCNGQGVINNPAFFSFISNSTSLDFTIDVSNCETGSNFIGLQANVVDPCDLNTCYGDSGAACHTEEFSFTASNLIAGQEYQFVIDGCDGNVCDFVINISSSEVVVDVDGDGYASENDCDDSNPDINPGAEETCDGVDNNCDGEVDEDLTFVTYYADLDMDGFGDGEGFDECVVPPGATTQSGDCNDNDPTVYPGAEDITINGIDENCDGVDGVSGLKEIDGIVVEVYPNPVKDRLYLRTKLHSLYYQLLNINGRIIKQGAPGESIDMSDIESGVYIIKITSREREGEVVERIVRI